MNYEVIEPISKKENVSVYLVSSSDHNTPVILKRIQGGSFSIFQQIKNIKNEYLPEIYDLDQEDDTLLVLEEYIDGVTLADYVKEQNPAFDEIMDIFGQICEGIATLHNQTPPLIHRDIKPSNILITGEKKPVIIDFNATRSYKEDSEKDTISLGTMEYAPPEQFGFTQTDTRSDVYAMGITMHKLLSELGYGEEASKIIAKATMFEPGMRYASMELLRKDINKCKLSKNKPKKLLIALGFVCIVSILGLLLCTFVFSSSNKTIDHKKNAQKKPPATMTTKNPEATPLPDPPKHDVSQDEDLPFYFIQTEVDEFKGPEYWIMYFYPDFPYLTFSSVGQTIDPNAIATNVEIGVLKSGQTDGDDMKVLDYKDWSQEENYVTISPEYLATLKPGRKYQVVVHYENFLFAYHVRIINDFKQINRQGEVYFASPSKDYWKDSYDTLHFRICNGLGRELISLVNSTTGETIAENQYDYEKDKGVLTLKSGYLGTLEPGKEYNFDTEWGMGDTKSFDGCKASFSVNCAKRNHK